MVVFRSSADPLSNNSSRYLRGTPRANPSGLNWRRSSSLWSQVRHPDVISIFRETPPAKARRQNAPSIGTRLDRCVDRFGFDHCSFINAPELNGNAALAASSLPTEHGVTSCGNLRKRSRDPRCKSQFPSRVLREDVCGEPRKIRGPVSRRQRGNQTSRFRESLPKAFKAARFFASMSC